MTIPWAYRPGGGFIVLVASLAICAAFFTFGAATPQLERVWRVLLELRLGSESRRVKALDEGARAALEQALCRHRGLAEDLLLGQPGILLSANRDGVFDGGVAYALRSADHPEVAIEIAVPPGGKETRIVIEARAGDGSSRGEASVGRPFTLHPRGRDGCPTLVELRSEASAERAGPAKKRAKPAPALVTFRRGAEPAAAGSAGGSP